MNYIHQISEDPLAELEEIDGEDFEDLPHPLVEFIHEQDGLQFNKRKISCRSDLELTFIQLEKLQRGQGSPRSLDTLTLATIVLISYGWVLGRKRRPGLENLLIFREPPYNVIPRKCSGCDGEFLNDAVSQWSKFDPDIYVPWYLHWGCGRADCEAHITLVPLSSRTQHYPAVVSKLSEEAQKTRRSRFDYWFIRREDELGDLPRTIEVYCGGRGGKGCPLNAKREVPARYTAESNARIVAPSHRCECTGRYMKWLPRKGKVVHPSTLATLWKELSGDGFDVTQYPCLPEVYFARGFVADRRILLMNAQKEIENKKAAARVPVTVKSSILIEGQKQIAKMAPERKRKASETSEAGTGEYFF